MFQPDVLGPINYGKYFVRQSLPFLVRTNYADLKFVAKSLEKEVMELA